jgi:hypothetical protein
LVGLHEPALTSGGLGARVVSEFAKTFQRDLRTTSEGFVSGGFFVGRTPKDSVQEVRNLEGGTASGDGVRRYHSGFGVDYPDPENGSGKRCGWDDK